MSKHKIIHATLVEIEGKGILITGKSGSGKSDLALRLIENKKAILVADDVVELEKSSQNFLEGSAPENIRGLMEIRGLGIVKMNYKSKSSIELVVNLVNDYVDLERMPKIVTENILGLEIPKIDLYARESSAPDKVFMKLEGVFINDMSL